MNKKGFMMAEVVVVSVIIIGSIAAFFAGYNGLITLYSDRIDYYDSTTLYELANYRDVNLSDLEVSSSPIRKVGAGRIIYYVDGKLLNGKPEDGEIQTPSNNTFKKYIEYLKNTLDLTNKDNENKKILIMEKCASNDDCKYAYLEPLMVDMTPTIPSAGEIKEIKIAFIMGVSRVSFSNIDPVTNHGEYQNLMNAARAYDAINNKINAINKGNFNVKFVVDSYYANGSNTSIYDSSYGFKMTTFDKTKLLFSTGLSKNDTGYSEALEKTAEIWFAGGLDCSNNSLAYIARETELGQIDYKYVFYFMPYSSGGFCTTIFDSTNENISLLKKYCSNAGSCIEKLIANPNLKYIVIGNNSDNINETGSASYGFNNLDIDFEKIITDIVEDYK